MMINELYLCEWGDLVVVLAGCGIMMEIKLTKTPADISPTSAHQKAILFVPSECE